MHPCPFCHSRDVYAVQTITTEQHLDLRQYETTPALWDYIVRDEIEHDVQCGRVTCATCEREFRFNDARYAATWPDPPEELPYDHDSSYSGCREGCEACAWEASHSAQTWPD